jgi:hypothetical protein
MTLSRPSAGGIRSSATADFGQWPAIALALVGGLAAVVCALVSGPVLPGQAATRLTGAAVAVLCVLGGAFGLLGCIGALVAVVRRRLGTAALLTAAGGLAITGFAVPAGLALLWGAVLMAEERS